MITNHTPFRIELTSGIDDRDCPYLLIVWGGVFIGGPTSPMTLSPEEAPLHFVDMWHGEPGHSSLKTEADIAPEKRRVDVLVNGRAHAPQGRQVRSLNVGLRVAEIDKRLLITGDVAKRSDLSRDDTPAGFTTMPIVYERAFGGTSQSGRVDLANPVGLGFEGAPSSDPGVRTVAPNIWYPDRRHVAAGLGPLARQWMPRIAEAGTYDADWRRERWPLLPMDFDPSYFQCAPSDQQSERIRGGELVELFNLTPEGYWSFRLPSIDVSVFLCHGSRVKQDRLRTDTVVIEPDDYRVTLKGRLKLPVVRGAPPLRQVVVGSVTPGWLRAKKTGKAYWDPAKGGGRHPVQTLFEA